MTKDDLRSVAVLFVLIELLHAPMDEVARVLVLLRFRLRIDRRLCGFRQLVDLLTQARGALGRSRVRFFRHGHTSRVAPVGKDKEGLGGSQGFEGGREAAALDRRSAGGSDQSPSRTRRA